MLHAWCCTESHIQRSTPLSMPFLIFLGASFPFTYERDHAEAHISVRWILACSMISVDNYWYFFSKINRPIQKAVEPPSQLNHGTIQVERSWKTTVKSSSSLSVVPTALRLELGVIVAHKHPKSIPLFNINWLSIRHEDCKKRLKIFLSGLSYDEKTERD